MKNFNNDAVVPFLWVRNEDEKTIEKEIDAIKALSINAFMIESRPRVLSESDFGEKSWFTRVGKILAYAQKLNMRVWLLDDRSFPTGSANGKILTKYPHLKAKQLKVMAKDVYLSNVHSLVQTGIKKGTNDEILCGYLLGERAIKLNVEPNAELCVLPSLKGKFRAVFLIVTEDSPEREGYIDMLNPDSVNVLIEEVYKPHYENFKQYFGKTFMGYFSDEHRFCNGINWIYDNPVDMYSFRPGKMQVAYPFSYNTLDLLYEKGYKESDLLNLYFDFDNNSADFRVDYMNIITDAYANNFVSNLANWCNERGVSYSGHVIEDMGVHMTLGCGAGHYFKAMKNADYTGVDVVLHQIKPFYTDGKTISPIAGGLADQEFFHYTLAKLASSAAVLSENANGKSFCEIFGAYGWGEKISDMLYLINHMAVRGINHFIPHAFSMNLYDTDCPPYFYGEGKNPSLGGYKQLFNYMNKLCGLDSSNSFARVAVYYNAESVWCGKDYLNIDKVAKELTENQVEFDFIDYENLQDASFVDGKIVKNNCVYDALIVPNGYFNKQLQAQFERFKGIIYIANEQDLSKVVKNVKNAINLPYHFSKTDKGLRSKLFNSGEILLVNESEQDVSNTLIYSGEQLFAVNPLTNELRFSCVGGKLDFSIKSGESLIVYKNLPENVVKLQNLTSKDIVGRFNVCVRSFGQNEYQTLGEKGVEFCYALENPDFSGFIKYSFEKEFVDGEYIQVDFYGEYLRINAFGKEVDYITSPALIKAESGKQKVVLTVNNTLANEMKDLLSQFAEISACGIKNVNILTEKK